MDMIDTNDKQPQQRRDSGGSLDDLLTSFQQGVTAINNLTQAMSAIFPSS